MRSCETPLFLAYFMAAYLMSSLIYLIISPSLGTPFKDSLTPAQKAIKEASSRSRSRLFMGGFAISALFLVATQPFKECGLTADVKVEV
jgi:hypothetical protein